MRTRIGLVATFAVVAALLFGVYSFFHEHIFLVSAPSMRGGLYYLHPGTVPKRGKVAIACVPRSFAQWALATGILKRDARCDGVEPAAKRVVALGGDRVAITARGVFVNGHFERGSQRLTLYHGRRMPATPLATFRLRPGEVLLLGDNRSASFDGRYFGPTDHVLGRADLILPL